MNMRMSKNRTRKNKHHRNHKKGGAGAGAQMGADMKDAAKAVGKTATGSVS